MPKRKTVTQKSSGNGANLGFEQTLWQAADKQPGIGKLLDEAMLAIKKENQQGGQRRGAIRQGKEGAN